MEAINTILQAIGLGILVAAGLLAAGYAAVFLAGRIAHVVYSERENHPLHYKNSGKIINVQVIVDGRMPMEDVDLFLGKVKKTLKDINNG